MAPGGCWAKRGEIEADDRAFHVSDRDSFIDEVTEEVRRDRLFALMRRWAWVAVLAVLVLVGGAAWNEWRKAQDRAEARALGDAILAALETDAPAERAEALAEIDAESTGGQAVLRLLTAGERAAAGEDEQAADALNAIATDGELPEIYRQIASYKALIRQQETMEPATRRQGFEALAQPGSALRLLAEEQLALMQIEAGETDAALERLRGILADAEVTAGLRRRASQLIVALGGDPSTVSQG